MHPSHHRGFCVTREPRGQECWKRGSGVPLIGNSNSQLSQGLGLQLEIPTGLGRCLINWDLSQGCYTMQGDDKQERLMQQYLA